MSNMSWEEAIVSQRTAGTAFNNYTTAKTVIDQTALYTLPAGYFTPGKQIRMKVRGSISNIVTTPGTVTFQVMLGSAVVYTSGAVQLNATAHTTLPFTFECDLVCRATGTGTSANLMGMGEVRGVMFTATAGQTDGANTQTILQVPQTAPAVGAGFDSTIANILDFWVGFSIANAGNQVQVQVYTVEAMN